MPEPNKRRAVVGLGPARKEFEQLVRERLLAEGGSEAVERDLRRLEQEARRVTQEARRRV